MTQPPHPPQPDPYGQPQPQPFTPPAPSYYVQQPPTDPYGQPQGTPYAPPPYGQAQGYHPQGAHGPILPEGGSPAGLPPIAPPPPTRPSAWNLPAFVMLFIFLAALAALLFPQYKARKIEAKVNPLVAGLTDRTDTSARCPRYITAIFGAVGSVSLDANGNPSSRTDLTGPVCQGLDRLYSTEGRAEMQCLVTDGRCSPEALRSLVALSVVAHESMHLRGILDEREAECASIGAGVQSATLAGLSEEQGRMIGYVHLMALNPNTPPQYRLSPDSCVHAARLVRDPPGSEAARSALVTAAEQTWVTLGED